METLNKNERYYLLTSIFLQYLSQFQFQHNSLEKRKIRCYHMSNFMSNRQTIPTDWLIISSNINEIKLGESSIKFIEQSNLISPQFLPTQISKIFYYEYQNWLQLEVLKTHHNHDILIVGKEHLTPEEILNEKGWVWSTF